MINIGLLVVFAVLGAGLGVGYNFLVIKNYPEKRRKANYVLTVIVFLIVTVALFCIVSVRSFVDTTVKVKSQDTEQYIKDNYANNGFVKNGLDLTGISDNLSRIDNMVVELKSLLPSHTELKIKKGLYDFIANFLTKELQKRLKAVDFSKKNSFADDNNVLTVSSIINNLQRSIMKIVNIVLLVIASIFIIILLVHIIKSLIIAAKAKKAG